MRIFHSELAANPAYYSFGYSVYGQMEEGESLDQAYEQGFVPFIGAREQEDRLVYMARGSRVPLDTYTELHDQHGVMSKLEKLGLLPIEVRVWEKREFTRTEDLVLFLYRYFTFRFGKGSVPEERVRALLASPLLTHISEYSINGKPAGYVLETHTENYYHLWYEAYAKEYQGKHVGMYLFIDFIRRAKADGKKYAHLGSTYGNWMRYKTNFKGLEYWNGREWVRDLKGMKRLLAGDPERLLGFVDEWRSARSPYYPAPYPFRSIFQELRFFILFSVAQRRIFGMLMILLGLLILATWFALFIF